ncbi:MAG: hypothetical protein ING73_16250, partial [Rhodocyclaceae bacterium]|nr:hypothetical protein [Rhodocyclaceae bacterium]
MNAANMTTRHTKPADFMWTNCFLKVFVKAGAMLTGLLLATPLLSFAQGTTPQTITAFSPATPISFSNAATFTLSATGGGSTSPVVFASNTAPVCTVSGATVSVLSVGSCVLTANQAGDATYADAAEVQKTVVVNKGSQTIAFAALANRTMVPATFVLTATASSGLPISYTTSTSTKCTISGVTVTLVATGTCSITANQAGNSNFNAATSVAQGFSISLEPQTITFPAIGPKFILDSPLTLSATANSGLAVAFTTNSPAICSVSGNTVTLLAPGNCYLFAAQAGNTSYSSAQVSQLVVVSKTNQTVTFPTIGPKFILESPLTLSAT